MTPEKKAKELMDKYMKLTDGLLWLSKQAAIICVDEFIYETKGDAVNDWWVDVKKYIETYKQ